MPPFVGAVFARVYYGNYGWDLYELAGVGIIYGLISDYEMPDRAA